MSLFYIVFKCGRVRACLPVYVCGEGGAGGCDILSVQSSGSKVAEEGFWLVGFMRVR